MPLLTYAIHPREACDRQTYLACGVILRVAHNLTDLHGCAEATPLTTEGEGHLSLPAGSRS